MNKKWYNIPIKENVLLLVIPSVFIVLVGVLFIIYGVQEPARTQVPHQPTLYDDQIRLSNTILDDINQGGYQEMNPYVVVNPFDISPLSALIVFESEEASQYVIEVVGKTEDATLVYDSALGTSHQIPVYGLYADYDNTVNLYDYDAVLQQKGELVTTISITTDPLPDNVYNASEIDTTYEYFGDDWMLLTPATSNLPLAIDAFGDVRWYSSTPLAFAMKPLENGHFLVGGNRVMSDPYYTSGLFEMDLLGQVYQIYTIPGGYHHDFVEMPDGNLLVLSSDFNGTVEDIVVELDRETGLVVDTIDIAQFIDPLEGMSQMWTTSDWFHNNSIDYDVASDSILLSGRHQDIVISIDNATRTLNYVIGDPEGWDETFVSDYFLTPIGTDFEWSYAQHSAMYLPSGEVFLFDNGNNRSKNSETYVSANNNYSRGVIYDINENSRTIKQTHAFGANRGNNFYSPYISNVDYYADGHYMIHSGGIARTLEGALNIPAPLYEGDLDVTKQSVTVEVLDGVIQYELTMPDHYYQAIRIDPTDYTDIEITTPVVLGKQRVTSRYSGTIEDRFTLFRSVPRSRRVKFMKEYDRLVIEGAFEQGDVVYLELVQDGSILRYHIPTSQTAFTAMCTNIFNDNERFITYYINEENLSGRYDIHIRINDRLFDSYEWVEFD